MTIIRHELKQGRMTFIIWTCVIAFMLAVCILIYPEMGTQMEDVGSMFSEMGSFSAAFGMDRLNFGEFLGFFGVECGNILGLGGAFFAALSGISILAKEEKEQTAEFLLTHPVSRRKNRSFRQSSTVIRLHWASVCWKSCSTSVTAGQRYSSAAHSKCRYRLR